MKSMNTTFLKLLFIIVILILVYKSYKYKCQENFTSDITFDNANDLLIYKKDSLYICNKFLKQWHDLYLFGKQKI